MNNESEDFYYEGEWVVFTEKYLLRRGFCCHNKCRHCPYKKRVISMVPSWTETLVNAGVEVIGCTRFCLHPEESIKNIPRVGGTKNWNWEKILEIKPDLILLDQEENPKFMSEQNSFKWHASHIQNISDMPGELDRLAQIFSNSELKSLSIRWQNIVDQKKSKPRPDLAQLPGVLEWGLRPNQPIKKVLYLIWKDPWMAVSRNTFIGSVLDLLGLELIQFSEKYPQINLDDFDPKETLILFSSEPYPFLKRKQELSSIVFPHAFVDGEVFSWFGVRSLEFLEKS